VNTYSIKIALRDVSPMIWRRLRIDGNTSTADLHYIIQIAMGWDDDYLHHFHIHGIDYGLSRSGCGSFRYDAEMVFIDDFTFDVGDRFTDRLSWPKPPKRFTTAGRFALAGIETDCSRMNGWGVL
jgi:hypothetical protein